MWLLCAGLNAVEAAKRNDDWRWFTVAAYLFGAVGSYVSLYKISKRIPKELID
jgi:hypothetical protein